MLKRVKNIFSLLLISGIIFSCVPARQFSDLKEKSRRCEEERSILKDENKDLTVKSTELEAEVSDLTKRVNALVKDTTVMGISLRKLTNQYDKINRLNDELLDKQKLLLQGNAAETRTLLADLQQAQLDLQKKEDALKELEKTIDAKKVNIENMQVALSAQDQELEAKNKRLIELENILSRKDSVVNALKDKVLNALVGFADDGLTVVQKNGKVYVSLDEKLLFKSGSTTVDPKGVKALNKLATVLEKNEDINVMIEGHTDNVPFNGSNGIKDNWDLSVKRATSIVKIILSNSTVDPQRLLAAGRGEFMPIDPADTKEARQRNRRTEIILTPKLDELFNILNN